LKYDDVMSRQRDAIYNDRRHILEGDDIKARIETFLSEVIEDVVNQHIVEGSGKDWDLESLWGDLKTIYPIGLEISEVLAEAGNRNKLTRAWLAREIGSDAKIAYDKREAEIGEAAMRELERRVVMSVIDRKWRDHLYEMDYLQEGIGLRAMAQRDPLVEYQREGYDLFMAMMDSIKEELVGFIFHVEVEVDNSGSEGAPLVEAKGLSPAIAPVTELRYSAADEDGSVVSSGGDSTSRNAPCPCGSGKKYKRCHGAA
jgi:preprotein translocase subunit SecA